MATGTEILARALKSGAPAMGIDCIVIGAGIIGLAVARALANSGREVLVVEKERSFGLGNSSKNSEVVHAGLNYPKGSLKAELSVSGRRELYAYCRERGIKNAKLGKFIVATNKSQLGILDELMRKGITNGVEGLTFVDGSSVRKEEPNVYCEKALFSPESGIVDTNAIMASFLKEATSNRASVKYNTVVNGGVITEKGEIVVRLTGTNRSPNGELNGEVMRRETEDKEALILKPRTLVNSAGLDAVALANSIAGFPSKFIPRQYFAKGNYFLLAPEASGKVFSRLIYPIPENGGLGTHVTLDFDGQVKFGPDVQWLEEREARKAVSGFHEYDFSVDPKRGQKFESEVRKYYPGLPEGSLLPGFSGIRPIIRGPTEPTADFLIQGADVHGVEGLIHMFGMESPGLTSCLAIGRYVERIANRE